MCALADDDEWCPIGGVSVGATCTEQGGHRAAHGFGAAGLGVGLELIEGLGDQLHGRPELDRPVRYEQRARARIEEGPSQARQSLRARLVVLAGRRVAGREDDPVGIEFELGDLGRGEQAVVLSLAVCGGVRSNAGSALVAVSISVSPASSPCVAKCTTRACARLPLAESL